MFLAKSLKERLKKNYLEYETDSFKKESRENQLPPLNLKALLNFRGINQGLPPYPQEEMSSQQLKALDKNEWKSHFTIERLQKPWETRVPLDFYHHHKKFSDEIISPQTKESKEFVKNLIDKDILELKPKEWTNSTDVYSKVQPELKKTIFEVNHGLKDFKIIPLKEQKCPEGCDSRNVFEINGNRWEVSTQIDPYNTFSKYNEIKEKANENSKRYWKDNELNRQNQSEFPISEDRKKIENIRYFQQYRTPFQKSKDHDKMMKKVKELSTDEYITVQQDVLHNNPGCKCPEKINALISKQMYNIYKKKYNELTGKIHKEKEKKTFHWNDSDLSNKIISIEPINDIYWLKPTSLTKDKRSQSCSQLIRKEMLKNLVIKGSDIQRKEEEIKEQKEEEIKKQKNKEWLHRRTSPKTSHLKINKSLIMKSKYPIDKKLYESLPKLQHSYSLKDLSSENGEIHIDCKSVLVKNESDEETKRGKQSEEIKVFLEAYKEITEREMDNNNKRKSNKKVKSEKTFNYKHPGIYRLFEYKENVYIPNENKDDTEERKLVNNARYKLWSCCMNEDYLSKGCQKVRTAKSKSYQNI